MMRKFLCDCSDAHVVKSARTERCRTGPAEHSPSLCWGNWFNVCEWLCYVRGLLLVQRSKYRLSIRPMRCWNALRPRPAGLQLGYGCCWLPAMSCYRPMGGKFKLDFLKQITENQKPIQRLDIQPTPTAQRITSATRAFVTMMRLFLHAALERFSIDSLVSESS